MPAETAISFGWKNAWLAIASEDPLRVIDGIGIREPRATGWPEGIEKAYGHYTSREVFVTPSIAGWVLAVGSPISELGPERVVELSEKLGTEVLRFSTHTVVGHDAWIRADRGRLVRAYEYTEGRVVVERGEISAAEIEAGIADGPPDQEVTVFELADEWSIDPSTLEERGDVGSGWIGSM